MDIDDTVNKQQYTSALKRAAATHTTTRNSPDRAGSNGSSGGGVPTLQQPLQVWVATMRGNHGEDSCPIGHVVGVFKQRSAALRACVADWEKRYSSYRMRVDATAGKVTCESSDFIERYEWIVEKFPVL
eukprot:CAMPEP_0167825974 /NCGR_PEP_ID=MMETSP0112_2-20121227/9714_1 /TAXON_ID=91324 /ORGANISM="Lotharella globosa, Strain CCCM811" /LENGTH=128 /DNA_ID=CAMNT_0007728241 /DNA_START=571 /DNA_END=958 /DNA_ORIENTATION=+